MHLAPLRPLAAAVVALLGVGLATAARAQAPTPGPGPRPPAVTSPEVQPDRHITFRLLAPQATTVQLTGSDIPGLGAGVAMTKGDNGVWETTIGPVDPGAYRYTFSVDGVPVVDPRSPSVSESLGNVWSLVYVPGSDFMDTKNVPHGAIASVTYYSTALSKFRRMHVYTPPGYESGRDRYPVFYLLHGAGDSDDSWSTVGRAGFILDNLIAAKKAKPMVVVMPAGHTRPFGFGGPPRAAGAAPPPDEFVQDFVTDIRPYVEAHYRTLNDRAHRAIAGLSMGGSQTLNIAFGHLDQYAYVGVFSSGLFGITGPMRPRNSVTPALSAPGPFPWEQEHLATLDDPGLKKGLRLLWFRTGRDDFLIGTSRATVDMLNKHGFHATFAESPGAHTWINWRNYLNEFAPQLFQ